MKWALRFPSSYGWIVVVSSVCCFVSYFVNLVPARFLSICPLVDAIYFSRYLRTFSWFRPGHVFKKCFYCLEPHRFLRALGNIMNKCDEFFHCDGLVIIISLMWGVRFEWELTQSVWCVAPAFPYCRVIFDDVHLRVVKNHFVSVVHQWGNYN